MSVKGASSQVQGTEISDSKKEDQILSTKRTAEQQEAELALYPSPCREIAGISPPFGIPYNGLDGDATSIGSSAALVGGSSGGFSPEQ
jgi:hypothetical protein